MIIRSQDKRKITTDLNLYIEPRQREANGDVTFRIKNDKMGILGSYYSREKTIKVLDMICEAYSRCESTKELASGILLEAAKRFSQNEAEEFKKEHRAIFVFQMPQDSEV